MPHCARRGYDLVALARCHEEQRPAKVVGVELSSTAAQEARAYVAEQLGNRSTSGSSSPAGCEVRVDDGDFFELPGPPYDVGYDYT